MRRHGLFVAPVAALALVLTACGSPAAPEPVSTPTEAVSGSQEPSIGDVVVPDPDSTQAPSWSREARPYPMRDGTFILVGPNAPLPDVVRADMEARVAELSPTQVGADLGAVDASYAAFERLAQTFRNETGRAAVIFTNTVSPSTGLSRWTHFGGTARENIPSSESLTGNESTFEEYQKKVFDRSNEDYFDVFVR